QQSSAIAAGVDALVDADPTATVVVSGDLNMEPGEVPFEELVGPRDARSGNRMLVALDALPIEDRFSFGTGSRRALFDHVLDTSGAGYAASGVRIAHINSTATKAQQADVGVANGSSDHDPVLVTLSR
ncbi:MAG: hypothetical protein H7287_02670, partial [Thermoleophilia bacterium]|nr:hypothetical protein [Thermoleophilia bacterium]